MATIIHSAPPKALNHTQMEILRKTFGEKNYTTQWSLGNPIPHDYLVITAAGRDSFADDIAEEDLVSFDEAAEHLASESNPVSDIIRPTDSPEPKLTVTDALTVLDMAITESLVNQKTPEHIKADLRVLQRLTKSLSAIYPFTPEQNLNAALARKIRCAAALREVFSELMEVYQDVMEGKFHYTRNYEPEQETVG